MHSRVLRTAFHIHFFTQQFNLIIPVLGSAGNLIITLIKGTGFYCSFFEVCLVWNWVMMSAILFVDGTCSFVILFHCLTSHFQAWILWFPTLYFCTLGKNNFVFYGTAGFLSCALNMNSDELLLTMYLKGHKENRDNVYVILFTSTCVQ